MTSKEDRQKLKEDEIYRVARKLNSVTQYNEHYPFVSLSECDC